MGVTVREALRSGGLSKARVIAGHIGLDRVVKYVDVMEVPDAEGWLRGDMLVVTTWFAIRDDEAAQCRLVETLARARGAGLAIKPGRFLGRIAESVIETANRCGLPLIEVPADVPYIEITHPLMAAILSAQTERLEHSLRVHQVFTRAALEGRGFGAVVSLLRELLGREVTLCDCAGKVLAAGGGAATLPLQQEIAWDAQEDPARVLTEAGEEYLVFPVSAAGRKYGYFLLGEPERPPGDLDLVALEHAGTVAALEVAKREAVQAVEQRLMTDFIDDLVRGDLPSEEMALARAEALGWKFAAPVAAVVADIDDFAGVVQAARDEQYVQTVKQKMAAAVRSVLGELSRGFLLGGKSDSTVAFVNVPGAVSDRSAAKKLREIVQAVLARAGAELKEATVSVAASKLHASIMEMSAGYREACETMAIGRAVLGRRMVATHDELDLYRLFYHSPRERLTELCDSLIGPLRRHDARNGTNLVETLRAYLRNNGSVKAAARELFIHRNTLAYRLKRIHRLLGAEFWTRRPQVLARPVRNLPF